MAEIRGQYREANLQRLKTAKRIAISVSQPGSDGATDMERPASQVTGRIYLNGASPGSKS